MTCFDRALRKVEPKTMRHRVLHFATVLVHRGLDLILRLDETWPWAGELATAFPRLRAASHNWSVLAPNPKAIPQTTQSKPRTRDHGRDRCPHKCRHRSEIPIDDIEAVILGPDE